MTVPEPTLTQDYTARLLMARRSTRWSPTTVNGAPAGWTAMTGATDILAPYVTRHPGSLDQFAGLTGDAAAQLLSVLPKQATSDRQNSGPTLACLLRAAAAHPGIVRVHGYLVAPDRPDERVGAEGVHLYLPDGPTTSWEIIWDRARTALGIDDAHTGPDEVEHGPGPDGAPCWYLWWD